MRVLGRSLTWKWLINKGLSIFFEIFGLYGAESIQKFHMLDLSEKIPSRLEKKSAA